MAFKFHLKGNSKCFKFYLKGKASKPAIKSIIVKVDPSTKKIKDPSTKKIKTEPKQGIIYLADRVYIPANKVSKSLVQKHYDKRVFEQNKCNNCPVYKNGERFNNLCSVCPAYKGRFTTFELVTIKDEDHFAIPAGDLKGVQKNLDIKFKEFEVDDMRANIPVKNPLKFTGKLYTGKEIINGLPTANQRNIILEFAMFKAGIIQAAPRVGKTVLATYIYCGARKRTLYLVHEKQLMKQFYRTVLDMTDLRQQRLATGKKICGIIQKDSDWDEDWDLVICNYHKFISTKGFLRLKNYIVKKFGQVMVDECHVSSAKGFLNLLNRIDARRRIGFSATPTRKDKLEFLMHQVLGPTVVIDKTEMAVPRVEIIRTGLKPKREWTGRAAYTYANQWLAGNRDRNIMILKHVFNDLRANPLHSIVIPVMIREQARGLAEMINRQAQLNNDRKGENWPTFVAAPYYADKKIDATNLFDSVRAGDIRVLIGIRKMMKLGLNVPRWTHMYLVSPMSNDEDFYQMSKRICTSYEGKPESVLKIFVDQIGLSLGCFRNTYMGGVVKNKYRVDEENRQIAHQLMERKKVREGDDIHGWG